MAKSKQLITFILFLSLLKLWESSGITLKMVHRDSVESPLYPGNLTSLEKFERYISISKNRADYLTSKSDFELPHPIVSIDGYLYLVKVGVGTPAKEAWLLLDTGSSLIWLQCEPCESCHNQTYPIFDPKLSSTYKRLPCHLSEFYFPECEDYCVDYCKYEKHYLDGTMTKGIASAETFTLDDAEFYPVIFGCSTWSNSSVLPNLAGILGFDMNYKSLIMQLGDTVDTRFSYCLVDPMTSEANTYLKFKNDMGYIGDDVKRTPFDDVPYSYSYYLKLIDISINGKRMNFPPGTFKASDEGEGGVLIDSGAVMSLFQKDVYDKLESEFIRYFLDFGLVPHPNCPFEELLCYTLQENFTSFPNMIYHFEGADMLIKPENVFYINRSLKLFTLAMWTKGKLNIIGAWNQHNTRMIFDIPRKTLFFVPENCAEDKWLN